MFSCETCSLITIGNNNIRLVPFRVLNCVYHLFSNETCSLVTIGNNNVRLVPFRVLICVYHLFVFSCETCSFVTIGNSNFRLVVIMFHKHIIFLFCTFVAPISSLDSLTPCPNQVDKTGVHTHIMLYSVVLPNVEYDSISHSIM